MIIKSNQINFIYEAQNPNHRASVGFTVYSEQHALSLDPRFQWGKTSHFIIVFLRTGETLTLRLSTSSVHVLFLEMTYVTIWKYLNSLTISAVLPARLQVFMVQSYLLQRSFWASDTNTRLCFISRMCSYSLTVVSSNKPSEKIFCLIVSAGVQLCAHSQQTTYNYFFFCEEHIRSTDSTCDPARRPVQGSV